MSHIFLRHLIAEQRHSNVFKLACKACRRHYPQESILRELTAFFKHTDFHPEELISVLSSGYKQVNKHALLPSPPTRPPFKRTKGHKGHMVLQKIPMPTTKPIGWERNSGKELLYSPEIRTIILPIYRITVLLKTEANENKMSLSFPNSVLPPKNPDNIYNFVQELPDHFLTDKTIQVGAKHDFNNRKAARPLKYLTD